MIDGGLARDRQIIDTYELVDYRAEFLLESSPVAEIDNLVQQIANQPGTRVYREDVGGWPVRITIVRDRLVPDISSMPSHQFTTARGTTVRNFTHPH